MGTLPWGQWWESEEPEDEMIEELQLLPFTPCRAWLACISGGGVMLGGMVEDHGLD